jgi:type II secretion system protein D
MHTRGRVFLWAVCVCLAASAAAQTTMPAAPATSEAAQAPSTDTSAPVGVQPERNIRFQFDGIPYAEVVRRFAQMSDKPLLGDLSIDGTLTFFDARPYTYQEAMDTLNLILEMKGYALQESGRFLRLMPLTDVAGRARVLPGAEDSGETRPGEIVTVVIPVRYVNAEDASKAVVRMVSPFGALSPMGTGKGIVITDRLENIQRIRGFIGMLDTETLVERQLRSYPLENAAARSVAESITNLFGPGKTPRRMVWNQERRRYAPGPEDPKDVITASYDDRSNLLLLIGSSDRLAMAEELVHRLDSEEAGQVDDVRVFSLKTARAEELAKTVLASVPSRQIGFDQKNKRPIMAKKATVVADKATNRLIVSGPIDEMARVEKLVKELDVASISVGGARVFPLQIADAQQLAPIVTNASVVIDPRGRRQAMLSVSAEPRTNSLIVAGAASDIQTAASLIEELDRRQDQDAREIHVISLKVGDARQLAGSLVRLFSQQAPGRRGSPQSPANLRVEADSGSNSLLISCTREDWPTIERILEDLKTSAEPAATKMTRLVPLKFAKASELADTLRQLYASRGSRRGQPSGVPVVIAPSERSNSLLISASAEDQEALLGLIESLDVDSAKMVDPIRIIRLESADSKKLAETLKAMLPPQPRGQASAVSIQADVLTNSVLIRAPEAERQMLEEMISRLDAATLNEARETRVLPLQHASASAVANTLRQLYPPAQSSSRGRWGRGGQETQEADRVVITPAPGDRALIIEAPRKKVAEIEALATSLDTKDALGKLQVRTYKIAQGSATDLARSLSRLYGPQRGQPQTGPQARFEADASGNQLLIAATEIQFEKIEETIQKLAATEIASRTQTFPLQFARANEVAPVLEKMLTATSASPSRSRRGGGGSPSDVRVAAMVTGNAVVVQGTEAKLKLAQQLIATFDTPDLAEKLQIHVVALQHARAETLVTTLRSMLPRASRGQEAVLEADVLTNSILVRAPQAQREMIQDLITSLDQSTEQQAREVRILQLENGSASAMAVVLTQLYQSPQASSRSRRWGAPTPPSSPDRVVITPSPNDRTLVVDAPRGKMEEIAQLVEKLDTQQLGARMELRTYQLSKSKATDIARSLARLFAQQRGRGQQTSKLQPRFEADAGSNQLLVAAASDQFAEIEQLIEKLQAAVAKTSLTKIFRLQHARADELVTVLRSMLGLEDTGSRPWWARGGGDSSAGVRVSVLSAANAVAVQGPPESLAMAEELIASFDQPGSAGEAEVRTYQLKNSKATDVARSLGRIYAQRARGGRGGSAPQPRFEADATSNQLIVAARPGEFEEIEKVVDELQAATVLAVQTRTYRLEHARAEDLVKVIEPMLGEESGRPSWMGRSGGDQTPVQIASLPAANTLVIQGPPEKLALAEQLIETFDRPDSGVRSVIEVVHLKNAQAQTLADSVTRTITSGRARQPWWAGGQQAAEPVTVTPESNSNSILVRGAAQEVAPVVEMIHELDEESTSAVASMRIYPLANGEARELANSLGRMFRDILRQQSRGRRNAPTPPFSVTADDRTNSLVISTTPAHFALVEKLLADLDKAPERPARGVQYVWLDHADATEVALKIDTMFSELRGSDRPFVEADFYTNALTIIAKEAQLKEIEGVVRQLDKAAEDRSVHVRVIALTASKAEKMAEVLRRVYGQMSDSEVVVTDRLPARAQPKAGEVLLPSYAPDPDIEGEEAPVTPSSPQGEEASSGGPAASRARSVTIAVDKASNALIISGTRQELAELENLVDQLATSEVEAEAEFRVFTMKKADPGSVAQTLTSLFNPPKRKVQVKKGEPTPPEPPPVISVVADARTRSLFVRAKPIDFEIIEPMIERLDEVSTVISEVRVFEVRNSDAVEVAANLRELFALSTGAGKPMAKPAKGDDKKPAQQQRAESVRRMIELRQAGGVAQVDTATTVSITANRRSNSVVVAAPPDAMVLVEQIIQELDQSAGRSSAPTVRLYPLEHAEVRTTVASLQQVFAAGRGGSAQSREPEVRIAGDEGARMVIVSAPQEKHELVSQLLGDLDAAQGAEAMSIRVYRIQHVDASTLAGALGGTVGTAQTGRRRGGAQPQTLRINADRGSNSLIVRAGAEEHERIAALVAEMDVAPTSGLPPVRVLQLSNADATNVARILQRVVAASAMSARGGRGGATAQSVAIEADSDAQMLMVRADDETFERIRALATQLDQASQSKTPGVYIVPLEKGNASDVATMVRNLYREQTQAARRSGRGVETLAVSADERANALILACSQGMYEQVSAWVNRIEQMKPARGSMKLIVLEHADPAEVEKAIQQLYGGSSSAAPRGAGNRRRGAAGAGSTGSGGSVETTVLPGQRAILVTGSEEDSEAIEKLARSLDEAAAGTKREVRVFDLEHASNQRIVQALSATFAVRGARPEDQVTIRAVAQTNAIVVTASPEKMEEVAHLILQLDRKEISPAVDFRIYTLRHTMPTRILPTLRSMLSQIQRTRPGESINVQADTRTRSIIVTARPAVFEQIDKIIETLDRAPSYEKADVLIIPLKRADATRLAAVLNEMLRPSANNQVTPEARALQEQLRLLRVRSAVAEDVPELDLTQPIKISADPARPQGSNSLIVSSTPENLEAMRIIVSLMDTVPIADEVTVKLVILHNADASSAMQVLRDIFSQGQRLAGKPGTSAAGRSEPESVSGKALVSPLNVSADLRTNTLVLAGNNESLALGELILKDLDRAGANLVTEVRLFRLNHADAARLLPVLRAVFAEGAGQPGEVGLRTHVTRLQTVLDGAEGHVAQRPKVYPALTIQADATTNIVVVAARQDVMPLVADVIKTMDVPGAGSLNTVRIFPLHNADATRMRQVVSSLYTGPNARLLRDEDRPTVAVDPRTNSLVVSASETTFAMLDALLKRLDSETPPELRDIRLLPLANAEAASLATTLQRMMDARVQRQISLGVGDAEALRAIIVADARSNSLIVGGSAESFQIVNDLAKKLDSASPALGGQVQMLPLTHANAGTMVSTLTNLFNQRYQAARTPDVQRQRPIFLPDLRTNSLLVAANADDTKILLSLLEKLDVELLDPAVELVVLPLRHNDAGVVGPTIQRIFQARLTSMTPPGQQPTPQDRVDVATDALSNSLVISASRENLALIRGLLDQVDVEPPAETGVVRMFPLQNADAQRIASMLQSLVSQGLYKPGMGATGSAALAARERVAVTVDVRTNVLIVSASKENFAVIEEIIRGIDSAGDFGALGDLRIYTLKRADSSRLAVTLQNLFNAKLAAEQAAGGAGRALRVSIVPDARTNTLLVAGSRESFNAIEEMIHRLDGEETAAGSEFRVFPLKSATAGALQPTLEELFAQRIARGRTQDPVAIIADSRINALIVGASPEDMELAGILIGKLDTAAGGAGAGLNVFPLKKADASQVATTIQGLYSQGAGGTASVTVTADERTNALVVSAGEADLERIRELVEKLDQEQVASVTEIRVFPLRNADAADLAQILTSVLNNKPQSPTSASPNRQMLLQFVTRTSDGQELMASALQEGVLITPDSRANSLVVSAPVQNMGLLGSLIGALDSTSPRMAEIRVFKLINADATRMADVLQQLFRLQGGAGQDERAVSYTLVSTSQPASGKPVSATLGSDEQNALSITVDSRTNSLLVGGTQQYVDLCSTVIQELDSSPAQERMVEVYHPRNANPGDIETALRSFLDQENQSMTQTLGQTRVGSAQRLLEREVAVVSESTSGSLLLSASPRYFETLMKMVAELDKAPPQVLIQVLLAEVSLDDTTDLGMDWMFRDRYGKTEVKGGTDFGVEGSINTFGGLNLAISGSDLSFYLRALQNEGRLEILSRPQILAADNQEANINVGQRVPLITASRVNEDGVITNTIQYEQLGITLTVTPRINPDGFIRLDVNPVISSLSTSSVEITDGVQAQIINNRSAETTVTVHDGHTIAIGGLITTRDDSRERRVPILGDVPLIGPLFRSSTDIKERSELLIILTPRIIRNVEEADGITDDQIRRIELLRSDRDRDRKEAERKPLLRSLVSPYAGTSERVEEERGIVMPAAQ